MFYDLSLINFFFPTRKNLEIGLGLTNVLTISEFKAVLAHEFGHFAQKSMAVGRWVYTAQQVANQLMARLLDEVDSEAVEAPGPDAAMSLLDDVAADMLRSVKSHSGLWRSSSLRSQ